MSSFRPVIFTFIGRISYGLYFIYQQIPPQAILGWEFGALVNKVES